MTESYLTVTRWLSHTLVVNEYPDCILTLDARCVLLKTVDCEMSVSIAGTVATHTLHSTHRGTTFIELVAGIIEEAVLSDNSDWCRVSDACQTPDGCVTLVRKPHGNGAPPVHVLVSEDAGRQPGILRLIVEIKTPTGPETLVEEISCCDFDQAHRLAEESGAFVSSDE
jgi:hypothetical protein